jgi:hypothetical protein
LGLLLLRLATIFGLVALDATIQTLVVRPLLEFPGGLTTLPQRGAATQHE